MKKTLVARLLVGLALWFGLMAGPASAQYVSGATNLSGQAGLTPQPLSLSNTSCTTGVLCTASLVGGQSGSTYRLDQNLTGRFQLSGTTLSGVTNGVGQHTIQVTELNPKFTGSPLTSTIYLTTSAPSVSSLGTLTLSTSSGTPSSFSAVVNGQTSGSTLSLADNFRGSYVLNGTTLSRVSGGNLSLGLNYPVITETLAGSGNSPKSTTFAIAIASTVVPSFVQNVPTLAIVGSRGMLASGASSVSGSTFDREEWRLRFRTGRSPVTGLKMLWVSGAVGNAGAAWFPFPQDVTVCGAFEVAGTTTKAGLFGGSNCGTLPAGNSLVTTTGVVPSDLGIGSFGAGAGIFTRGEVTGLTSGQLLYGGSAASLATTPKEAFLASAGQTSQLTAVGDLSVTSRTAQSYSFGPSAILGNWVSTRDMSVVIAMDSVGWGAGDGTGAATQQGEGLTGGGFAARGLYSVPSSQSGKTVPWTKFSLGGAQVTTANQAPARALLAKVLPYATDLVTNYFYNDWGAGAQTKEQILASLISYCTFVNSYGVRCHWTTPMPSASSTDAYATLANQTLSGVNATGYTYAQAAAFVTAGMTTAYGNGTLVGGVIDTRAAWMDSSDPGKWKVNGTANYFVFTDNVHPSSAAHAAGAVVVGDYFGGLTIP